MSQQQPTTTKAENIASCDSDVGSESGWLFVDNINDFGLIPETNCGQPDNITLDVMSWPSLHSVTSRGGRTSSFGSDFSLIFAVSHTTSKDNNNNNNNNNKSFAQVVSECGGGHVGGHLLLRPKSKHTPNPNTSNKRSITSTKLTPKHQHSDEPETNTDAASLANQHIDAQLRIRCGRFEKTSRYYGLNGARGFRRCTCFSCRQSFRPTHCCDFAQRTSTIQRSASIPNEMTNSGVCYKTSLDAMLGVPHEYISPGPVMSLNKHRRWEKQLPELLESIAESSKIKATKRNFENRTIEYTLPVVGMSVASGKVVNELAEQQRHGSKVFMLRKGKEHVRSSDIDEETGDLWDVRDFVVEAFRISEFINFEKAVDAGMVNESEGEVGIVGNEHAGHFRIKELQGTLKCSGSSLLRGSQPWCRNNYHRAAWTAPITTSTSSGNYNGEGDSGERVNGFLEVDLRRTCNVTHVSTMGKLPDRKTWTPLQIPHLNNPVLHKHICEVYNEGYKFEWVTMYEVQYRVEGGRQWVTLGSFKGNENSHEEEFRAVERAVGGVMCRYLRFVPLKWNEKPSMRIGVFGWHVDEAERRCNISNSSHNNENDNHNNKNSNKKNNENNNNLEAKNKTSNTRKGAVVKELALDSVVGRMSEKVEFALGRVNTGEHTQTVASNSNRIFTKIAAPRYDWGKWGKDFGSNRGHRRRETVMKAVKEEVRDAEL